MPPRLSCRRRLPRDHRHHRCLAGAALLCATAGIAAPVRAHDSWFERRPGAAGELLLALGTGNQFPKQESGIGAEYVARQGCRAATLQTSLQRVRDEPTALLLRGLPQAATCWAQTTPFELTLSPDKIAPYLREIGAGPELRATWAGLQQRGLPWRERYTKHARIELGAPSAAPAPLGMDLLIEPAAGRTENTGRPLAGQTLNVRVLRDGQALAGQPVELRSSDLAIGIWRRSDAQGRLQVPLALPGRWLLRAVDLRLSDSRPDTWESRFVTLAFEAGPAATPPAAAPAVSVPTAQNGSSLKLNALSANHTAASAAISSEPPSSTASR